MRLPSFSALRSVEAVVRLGNVTRAAGELGVTQSAVSRQIIEFEAVLGVPLFERDRGRLVPTAAGRQLSREVAAAFRQINGAVASVQTLQPSRVLTVTMLPSVATKWLAPRLNTFLDIHRDVDLRITASRHLVDFRAEDVDAAIRYGRGYWPSVEAQLLARETVFPVCSPEYAQALNLRDPSDLAKAVLLHGDIPEDWHVWCRQANIADLPLTRGPHFADDTALIEAAVRNLGVALGRSALVDHDLRTGRLVAPFPQRVDTRFCYWFVWPQDALPKKSRQEFLAWLRVGFAATIDADLEQGGVTPADTASDRSTDPRELT